MDAWTRRVLDLELVIALKAYVEHFPDSVAYDDERHEQVRVELLVAEAMKCLFRVCTIAQ